MPHKDSRAKQAGKPLDCNALTSYQASWFLCPLFREPSLGQPSHFSSAVVYLSGSLLIRSCLPLGKPHPQLSPSRSAFSFTVVFLSSSVSFAVVSLSGNLLIRNCLPLEQPSHSQLSPSVAVVSLSSSRLIRSSLIDSSQQQFSLSFSFLGSIKHGALIKPDRPPDSVFGV